MIIVGEGHISGLKTRWAEVRQERYGRMGTLFYKKQRDTVRRTIYARSVICNKTWKSDHTQYELHSPKGSDNFFISQFLGFLCTSTVSRAGLNIFQASPSPLVWWRYDGKPFVRRLTVSADEPYAALHDQGNGLGGILREETCKAEQSERTATGKAESKEKRRRNNSLKPRNGDCSNSSRLFGIFGSGSVKTRGQIIFTFRHRKRIKAVGPWFIDFSHWTSRHQFRLNRAEKDHARKKGKNTCLCPIYRPPHQHGRTPGSLLKEMLITCFLMVELRLPLVGSEPPIGAGGKKQNRKVKRTLYGLCSKTRGFWRGEGATYTSRSQRLSLLQLTELQKDSKWL